MISHNLQQVRKPHYEEVGHFHYLITAQILLLHFTDSKRSYGCRALFPIEVDQRPHTEEEKNNNQMN
jgi:hypothetical protein